MKPSKILRQAKKQQSRAQIIILAIGTNNVFLLPAENVEKRVEKKKNDEVESEPIVKTIMADDDLQLQPISYI